MPLFLAVSFVYPGLGVYSATSLVSYLVFSGYCTCVSVWLCICYEIAPIFRSNVGRGCFGVVRLATRRRRRRWRWTTTRLRRRWRTQCRQFLLYETASRTMFSKTWYSPHKYPTCPNISAIHSALVLSVGRWTARMLRQISWTSSSWILSTCMLSPCYSRCIRNIFFADCLGSVCRSH